LINNFKIGNMKTKIILFAGFAVMLLIPRELKAQLKLGLHAGMNMETQAEIGQLWNNCEIYPGFLVGGILEVGAGKHISFQTELNYQKKGEKTSSSIEGEDAITKKELNYLSVPLLIKETVHDAGLGDKWDLTFFAGPYAGYLVSANSKMTVGNETNNEDIESQVEKSDFGALFGGGVKYKLNNGGAISAELRYEMGLAKIDKQNQDIRNKGFGLTIGYSF
jgi:hypothetical protein